MVGTLVLESTPKPRWGTVVELDPAVAVTEPEDPKDRTVSFLRVFAEQAFETSMVRLSIRVCGNAPTFFLLASVRKNCSGKE